MEFKYFQIKEKARKLASRFTFFKSSLVYVTFKIINLLTWNSKK